MNSTGSTETYSRYRAMWPLVPAIAMVMIDFTIVSISITTIGKDLHLTATAAQWTVTAYALATAAFVAIGGRLGDIIGHKRIVTIGVILFAVSSIFCGFTPDNSSFSEAWMIAFRALEGIGGALLIPSATVLILDAFPPKERGKGISIFFIVAGLFTALGPIAGSYLTEYWTWRAIFWINVPVAIFSLIELARSDLKDVRRPCRMDVPGSVLLVAGMALTVLGIQQSTVWGWGSVATLGSIIAGVALLIGFAVVELRAENPLIDLRTVVANRPFSVDSAIVFLFFTIWVAIFFFGSIYFQVAVGLPPSQAGFAILTVFYPFFVTSRIGGQLYDKVGVKRPVVLGLLVTAVGMALWGHELPTLSHSGTLWGMLVTGAGLGLVMSAVNTDALNRYAEDARGEASGIVQTVRNFGSAVGVAVMGTILITVFQGKIETLLESNGLDSSQAGKIAGSMLQTGAGGAGAAGGSGLGSIGKAIEGSYRLDFADALQVAFYVGAGVIVVGFLIALAFMPKGRQVGLE